MNEKNNLCTTFSILDAPKRKRLSKRRKRQNDSPNHVALRNNFFRKEMIKLSHKQLPFERNIFNV